MIIRTSHTQFGDIQYYEKDSIIATALSQNIAWEQGLILNHLADYVKNSKVILDVGSHVGCHSIVYAHLNPFATILGFEMQALMYDLYKKNIAINNLNNVHPYHCAVGDRVKMVPISSKITDGTNAGIDYSYFDEKAYNLGGVSIGEGNEDVMMITIDSLHLDSCDFIKIDVEGFEFFVIKGAIETIKKYKPIIFYESNHKKNSPYIEKLLDEMGEKGSVLNATGLLKEIGYKNFMDINGNDILAIYDGT